MQVIEGAGAYTTPPPDEHTHVIEHLRVPDLSVHTYSIPAGGVDDQTPHSEDEVYVVTSGRARIVTDSGDAAVGPGAVIFVPAGEMHRFVDVTEDLVTLVVFAPPYRSRALHAVSERTEG